MTMTTSIEINKQISK